MSPAPPRLLFLSPIVPARSGSGLAERDDESQNQSPTPATTSIPATFLRVTVRV
jgi:hypothetical protein